MSEERGARSLTSGYLWGAFFTSVGFFAFAMGEAWLRTSFVGGLTVADAMRALWGGLLFGLCASAAAGLLDALASLERRIWRSLAALVAVGPLLVAIYLAATEPRVAWGDVAPALFGAAAAAYLFGKSRVHVEVRAGIVGPSIALWAACYLLLPAQYGPDRWELNGLPITLLVLAILPAGIGFGAFLARDLEERGGRLSRIGFWGAGAGLVATLAALPFVFPGVIFFLKLVGAAVAIASALALIVPIAPSPERAARRVAILACAVSLIGAGGWSLAQSVSDRFGALGYDSVAGQAAAFASLPADRDGDGFYAGGVPIPDCDDTDASIFPGAPETPCITVELSVAPQSDDTWREEPRHVIVILSDALRAPDVYDSEKMPFVAKRGPGVVHFNRAYSPGNTTRLSVRSMWTGITPTRFVLEPGRAPRDDAWWFGNLPTTFAPLWIVASEFAWMHDPKQWMDDEALEHYIGETDERGRTIDASIDAVIEHLENLDGRRAAVGLFSTDPHAEYRCDDGAIDERRCYDDEIAALDTAIARLFTSLQRLGMLDDTVVVLSSDHGEEFGEHGHYGQHASTLFEEQIHVPLVFWYPELPQASISEPVSGMSIVPTLADLMGAGLAFPRADESLLPLMLDRVSGVPSPLVHHWTGLVLGVGVRRTAIIEEEWKLEYDWRTGHTRLANLVEDPAETRDFSHTKEGRKVTRRLLDELHRRQTEAMRWSEFGFVATDSPL